MTEKKRLNVIAVDLDGVILEFDFDRWIENPLYFGKPKQGAISALKKLRQSGYKIIIHTARLDDTKGISLFVDMLEYIKVVLKKNKVPYDSVWYLRGKPRADYYIDDKAIRFESWDQTLGVIDANS